MCIKIIGNQTLEYDQNEPLEAQVVGAREILVDWDISDYQKIDSFVLDIENMIKNGISCNAEIKVNANNYLEGIVLERHLDKLKQKLEVNEIAKGLSKLHAEADRKLCELSKICLGEN